VSGRYTRSQAHRRPYEIGIPQVICHAVSRKIKARGHAAIPREFDVARGRDLLHNVSYRKGGAVGRAAPGMSPRARRSYALY
jgi:hypothetical protein